MSAPLDRKFLQDAAGAVRQKLPDGYAFILLAAPTGAPAGPGEHRLVYVSDMTRESAISVLKEWLLKCGAAEDWMRHIT